MSEKTFRVVLFVVVAVWVVFVLLPSVADFLPRAWTNVQYFLPGEAPQVVVVVKDPRQQEGIEEARVQIVTEQATLVAITDKNGQAVFESVPAGRARQIKVQKLDYEIGVINQPAIPRRQRARFDIAMSSTYGRRMYVGHELSSVATGLSMLDTASRLPLTPPGNPTVWENLPAGDVRMTASAQHLYVLATDRLIVLSLHDGTVVKELPLQAPTGGLALDPSGESLYVLTGGPGGRGRYLTSIVTRTWVQRYQSEVTMGASKALLLPLSDGRRLYVVPIGEQMISVYDVQTPRRTALISTGDAIKDATLSTDSRTLYVLTERRQLPIAIDTTSNATLPSILDRTPDNTLAGATRLAYADLGSRKWLCLLQPTAQQASIIDLTARSVRTVAVGKEPTALLVLPASDQMYVTNRASNNLSLISLGEATLVDTVNVRSKPTFLVTP